MPNLAIYNGVAAKLSGETLIRAASATIEVRREDTGALASIFSDEAGTTPITNPSAFADANGNFKFYAEGLERGYRIDVTDGAFSLILRNQAVGTAQQFDKSVLASKVITAKGDLYVGGAAGVEARKAISTNGKILVGDSAQPDGLLWAPKAITPGGRLTLTTAVPVTTADVTGATTVYYTPHKHDIIELYDGAGWIPKQFTELSQATTDATKSPAAVAASKNYDVFVWNDGGTLRATRGPTWDAGAVAGSDTARGTGAGSTELELFEGRYVNKNAITNGPAARRGLYVGTIRSDGSAQINDTLAKRHVWNTYNRVPRPMRVYETNLSWTYSTAAFRQANGAPGNQLDYVAGFAEDSVSAIVHSQVVTSTATARATYAGIGVDSATVNSGTSGQVAPTSSFNVSPTSFYRGQPGLGRHTLVWLEQGGGADTQTWTGFVSGQTQSGIVGEIRA